MNEFSTLYTLLFVILGIVMLFLIGYGGWDARNPIDEAKLAQKDPQIYNYIELEKYESVWLTPDKKLCAFNRPKIDSGQLIKVNTNNWAYTLYKVSNIVNVGNNIQILEVNYYKYVMKPKT